MQDFENTQIVKVFSNMETCSVTWDSLLIFSRLQRIHVNGEDDIMRRAFIEVWIGRLKNQRANAEWEIKVIIVELLETFKWLMFIGGFPKEM